MLADKTQKQRNKHSQAEHQEGETDPPGVGRYQLGAEMGQQKAGGKDTRQGGKREPPEGQRSKPRGIAHGIEGNEGHQARYENDGHQGPLGALQTHETGASEPPLQDRP
jgi:hypothetical protein